MSEPLAARLVSACMALLVAAVSVVATAQDEFPILKLEAGPTNFISQLALSPEGEKLYAAGWDKVVHVWNRDPATGRYERAPKETYRIPIGPGGFGLINAMALSPDGRYLAVGGRGWSRGYSGVRSVGLIWPGRASDATMLLDRGQIYLFDTITRELRVFRGHRGVVKALCFAPGQEGEEPILVSAAEELGTQGPTGVLRAWNIGTRRELAAKGGIPAADIWVPVLQPVGPGSRVALAWGDDTTVDDRRTGKLRVWDISENNLTTNVAPPYTLTIDRGAAGLWTGAIGRVQPWKLNGNSLSAGTAVPVGRWVPVASAPVFERDRLTHVAYAMRYLSNELPSRYRLVLLDTQRKTLHQPLPEWTDAPVQSPLASAANGSVIALARGAEIHVYTPAQLAAAGEAQAQPQQVLQGLGQQVDAVQLATRGEATALQMQYTEHGQRKMALFDLEQSEFVDEPAGWTPQQHKAGGWTITASVRKADGHRILTTSLAGQQKASIDPFAYFPPEGARPDALEITATSLAPSHGLNPPLVAVAYAINGEPVLDLYHAEDGTLLRTFSGHTSRIHHLTFASQGSMLLSAASDRTVRVWNAGDVTEKTIGKIGLIEGLILADDEQGNLVVHQAGTTATAAGLAKGDLLQALVIEGQALELERSWDFYGQVSRQQPGSRVQVNIARDGQPMQVSLPVGQGADEHKPLYTLFFDLSDEEPHWIAWTPLGKYDVSDRSFERVLGWQFNPADMQAPVQFATAQQYREKSLEPNLLKNLLSIAPQPLPVPGTVIGFVEPEGAELVADHQGQFVTRGEQLKVYAELHDLPAKWISSVRYRVDGGEYRELPSAFGDVYSGEIASTGERSPRQVEVEVGTIDGRTFHYTRSVQFIPLPPELVSIEPAAPVSTREQKNLDLAARFVMHVAEADVQAVLTTSEGQQRQLTGQQLSSKVDPQNGQLLVELNQLALSPGKNQIQITVHNRGAIESTLADEQLSVSRTVFFAPADPPAIQLTSIMELPSGQQVGLAAEPLPTVTEAESVQLTGTVRSKEMPQLTLNGQPVALLQTGQLASFTVKLPMAQPGKNRFVLNATNSGGEQEVALEFLYRPALPRFVVDYRYGAPPARLRVGEDRLAISLSANAQRLNDHPAHWQVTINGKPLGEPRPIEQASEQLSFELSPEPERTPDVKRIAVRLFNEWGQSKLYPMGSVQLLHPPQVELVSLAQVEQKPLVDLAVKVRSPHRPLEAGQLFVDGVAMPVEPATEVINADPATSEQLFRYRLPASAGSHTVAYLAKNSDTTSTLLSQSIELAAAPDPATVRIEYPPNGRTFVERSVECKVYVGSPTPPTGGQLVVYGDGYVLQRISLTPANFRQVAPHGYLVQQPIQLAEGKNRLAVLVDNAGGRADATSQVAVSLPPVQILVEQFVTLPDGKVHPAELTRAGVGTRIPVNASRMRVQGKVRFANAELAAAQQEVPLRVWTNGFLKLARLRVDGKKESKFDVTVMLNQADNRIRVEVPDLAVEETSRLFVEDIRMATTQPELRQRLHLLGMGVRMEEGENVVTQEALRERIDEALRLRDEQNQAFAQVVRYGPLAGDRARPSTFISEFLNLTSAVRDSQLVDDLQDVVLIYYQGRAEEDREAGFILQDVENYRRPSAYRSSSITSERLVTMLQSIPGAHVLLLDVEEASPPNVAQAWPREPTLGIMRLARRETPQQPAQEGTYLLSMLTNALQNATSTQAVSLNTLAEAVQEEVNRAEETTLVYDPHFPPDVRQIVFFD